MKIKTVKNIRQNEFESLFDKVNAAVEETWKTEINHVLENHFHFSTSYSFWFLGDFVQGKTVDAGGFIESCTPWSKNQWIGIHPMEIARLIHPEEVTKVQSFIGHVAAFYAQKNTPQEIDKIKTSILFRMLNAENHYTWRIMTYPKVRYVNHQPVMLLTLITDFDQAPQDQTCSLFILDCNTNEKTLYHSGADDTDVHKYGNKHKLSPRELEVLFWLSKGFVSKEIAAKLGISKNTIENHKQHIFTKTATRNIAELVNFANKNRLI